MSHRFTWSVASLMLSLACPSLKGVTVKVRVADQTSVGIPKILVIVNSLEGKGEVCREFTDGKGFIPSLDLSPGLYQAIATDPYGPWVTKVKEVVVASVALELELRLEFVIIDRLPVATSKLPIQILNRDGRPISGATILARDLEAKYAFFWAHTDKHGRALVTLPLDGAELVTIYHDHVLSKEITVESALSRCDRRCTNNEIKELKRSLPQVTIRLP